MLSLLIYLLDFLACTEFRQCIPSISQTTDYKVHFGICHVLLNFMNTHLQFRLKSHPTTVELQWLEH